MAWKTRPARFNLKLVRAVRKAVARGEDCCGLAATSYPLLVTAPGTEHSDVYMVCLVQDDEGTYMATCREVPEVLVFDDSEGDAIGSAQTAIKKALAARGSSPNNRPPQNEAGPSGIARERYPLAMV